MTCIRLGWQMNIGNNNLWRSSATHTHTDCEISNLNISQIKFEITMDHPFIGEITTNIQRQLDPGGTFGRKPVDVDHPTGTQGPATHRCHPMGKILKIQPPVKQQGPKKSAEVYPIHITKDVVWQLQLQ